MNTITFKLELLEYINQYKEQKYIDLLYQNCNKDNYDLLYKNYNKLYSDYINLIKKIKYKYNFFIEDTINTFTNFNTIQKNNFNVLLIKYKKLQVEFNILNNCYKEINKTYNNNYFNQFYILFSLCQINI